MLFFSYQILFIRSLLDGKYLKVLTQQFKKYFKIDIAGQELCNIMETNLDQKLIF